MKPTICLICLLLLTALNAAAQVQPLQAWWIDTGDTDSTELGAQIVPLGDINGDGLNDIVVSAPGAEKLYVYLGSAQPDTVPYMVIPRPDNRLKWFGAAMYSLGDINGDGYLDFGVQATRSDGEPSHMFVYIYFGGNILDTIPDLILDGGEQFCSSFGRKGAGLGDINGDGGNDFAIMDENFISALQPAYTGRFYIYFGGEVLDSIPDVIINADSTHDRIARDIASLGDINYDGFNDYAMSQSLCDGLQGQENAGLIALYHGDSPPDTIPFISIRGTLSLDQLGKSLASMDFNNDGRLELIAGNDIDHPPSYNSSIYIYQVSDTMSGIPERMFMDEGVFGYHVGYNIFGMDLNGDSWQDIVDCEPNSALGNGRIYVFLGGPNSDSLYDATYYQGSGMGTGLASGACNAGDINGDGIDDLPVGEPGYGNPYEYIHYGRLHMILGNESLHQSGIIPEKQTALPNSFGIVRAYPNPFNSQVTFELNYPSFSNPRLKIYNLQGSLITEIPINFNQRRVLWDGHTPSGSICPSGIYIAALITRTHQSYQKIVLLR